MKEIRPEMIDKNVFDAIGKQWMLVGAIDGERTNAMTASWGGMGVLWNKPVAFVFIRPQRFTKKLIDAAPVFSLSFFGEEERGMLGYMGKASGANEDKIAHSGLKVQNSGGAPVFDRAQMTLICRKLYRQTIDKDCFIDKSVVANAYPNSDFHDMYIAEIEHVYVKE